MHNALWFSTSSAESIAIMVDELAKIAGGCLSYYRTKSRCAEQMERFGSKQDQRKQEQTQKHHEQDRSAQTGKTILKIAQGKVQQQLCRRSCGLAEGSPTIVVEKPAVAQMTVEVAQLQSTFGLFDVFALTRGQFSKFAHTLA